MSTKQRVSATVETELLAAGRAAVAEGRAANLSAWVNDALRRQTEHDVRIRAFDRFIDAYEAEHGEISDDEMREAARRARSRAVVVRTESTGQRGSAVSTTPGAA